ncbi:MAG: intracellular septation protein [Phenylobacterium sp.]|nr:MAG: intracellular septation protein [Phenylobacterium sp.]
MSNLLNAIRPLAWDFLPTIAFAILTALHVDVQIATAAAVGAGLLQVLAVKAMKRQVGLLQWAGLGLAVVFGAVSIATNDPRFVMFKPTLIYVAIGVVMLKRGWMLRYVPVIAHAHGGDLIVFWGYAWAALMALSAGLNAVIAIWFTKDWPLFIAVFPLASKLALFAVQYASMRVIVRGRIMAEMAAQAAQPQAQAA